MQGFMRVIYPDKPEEIFEFDAAPSPSELMAMIHGWCGGHIKMVDGVVKALGYKALACANDGNGGEMDCPYCANDGDGANLKPNIPATQILKQEQTLLGTVVITYGDDEFLLAL